MEAPDLIPISALEHYSYCPRQCALIYQDQVFDENLFTLRGQLVHQQVDEPPAAPTGGKEERALPLYSDTLGLIAKADIVEFHKGIPYPVEYKSGPASNRRHALVQLCAQAMCLEEMTGVAVPKGALFHHASRIRREVEFTTELRQRVRDITVAVRAMLREAHLPAAVHDARCRNCSLQDTCLPAVAGAGRRMGLLERRLFRTEEEP